MASKENCYLCGAEIGKTAIKDHILKRHNVEDGKQECRLLARNVSPQFACAKCGAAADYIDTEVMYSGENPFYCEACTADLDEDMLLPITNSPRMGVCGYCGEQDVYAFVPSDKKE